MGTSFAVSADGTRIAYDATGIGSPIVLLHGGGHTRQHWHRLGYVERLKSDFKVITMDIRGNGESDKPTDPAYYTTDKLGQDILAVADTSGVDRFTIWGFSYGGNIGRYLAAQSSRVAKIVIIGIPFGPGASGSFRRFIISFRDHWLPILKAQADGTLAFQSLSQDDQDALQGEDMPVTLAWLSAMLDWPAIEPGDVHCPALWLVGSKNEEAMASIRAYEESLKTSMVQVQVIDGLDHRQEFTEIDKVLPPMLAFTRL